MLKRKVLFAISISICILAGCQQKVDENGTSILLKNDANSTKQILTEHETDSTTQDSGEEDTSIPKEVCNFQAKVKEIDDSGSMLVTYLNVAEGFLPMNEGDYFVPKDSLTEEVVVGDVITIWFNGVILETYPAQLGQVYKIEISK